MTQLNSIWQEIFHKIQEFLSATPRFVLISGGLFILTFLISLGFFVRTSFVRQKQVLLFQEYQQRSLAPEVRSIPYRSNIEDRVASLVEELIWGPKDPRLQRVFPLGSKVRSVMLRKGVLYVDLSPDVLFASEDIRVAWEDRFQILKKTISFNFPRFKEIHISVYGQFPGSPPFVLQNPQKQ